MDLVLDATINYQLAAEKLRSMRLKTFHEIREDLNARRSQIKIIRGARESGLCEDDRLKTLSCVFDDGAYCGEVIDILSEEMPLMNNEMEESWDEDGDFVLAIAPESFAAWTFDEANDRLDDIENTGQEFSLSAFLLLMNWPVDEDVPGYWARCVDHFGWPMVEPLSLEYGTAINEKFLKRRLVKLGLEDLYYAVAQAWFPPGNVFLNANYEESESMYFEFTGENIDLLRADWKEAKPYFINFTMASTMVANDPGILATLAEVIEESQHRPKRRAGSRRKANDNQG